MCLEGIFDRVEEEGAGAAPFAVKEENLAAQTLQDVPRDGQAHADADGALGADERLEHGIADLGIDSVALVVDPDLDELAFLGFFDEFGVDGDGAGAVGFRAVAFPSVD